MKEYNVVISKQALYDLQIIYEYIVIKLMSPENAKNQFDRIADRVLKLSTMPERYKTFVFQPEKNKVIHRMNVYNYAVFFIINNETVTITDVLYGASDINQRLKYE